MTNQKEVVLQNIKISGDADVVDRFLSQYKISTEPQYHSATKGLINITDMNVFHRENAARRGIDKMINRHVEYILAQIRHYNLQEMTAFLNKFGMLELLDEETKNLLTYKVSK